MLERGEVAPVAVWVIPRTISGTVGVAAFVVMTALGAHVRIPLPWTPVPITLQTFFVALAGAALGPALGPLSQAIYLAAGAVGLPVFAGSLSGISYLIHGSTAGYLVGFVAATAITGRLVRRKRQPTYGWILASMAAGSLIAYAFGVGWLVASSGLSLPSAVVQGVLPFLAGDGLKICGAALLYRSYRRRAQVLLS